MSVTLKSIKEQQEKLTTMIATFEHQRARTVIFPELEIELAEGEHYAGIIIGKALALSYHVILLPEEKRNVDWDQANAWAATIGGILPSRRDQSLLLANLKGELLQEWYWSSEQSDANEDHAWVQGYIYGDQNTGHKSHKYQARAIRIIIIEK